MHDRPCISASATDYPIRESPREAIAHRHLTQELTQQLRQTTNHPKEKAPETSKFPGPFEW
jgi:hypothetical protein